MLIAIQDHYNSSNLEPRKSGKDDFMPGPRITGRKENEVKTKA